MLDIAAIKPVSSATIEFVPAEMAMNDNWICAICLKRIEKDLTRNIGFVRMSKVRLGFAVHTDCIEPEAIASNGLVVETGH